MPDGPGRPGERGGGRPPRTGSSTCSVSKAVLFATGGYGKVYKVTSNAHTLTGDGVAITYRRGLALEDMEFYQFHPTGMYKLGFLLSEAMRGEGGFLLNGKGERFMERYAPTMKDLASRDVVSRSIYQEIAAGPGDRRQGLRPPRRPPPGRARCSNEKLPDMSGFIRTYFGLEPLTDLVPIQPTAHYAMGGITDRHRRPGPGRREGARSCPASSRRGSAPASASTAPIGSAPTRCSTSSSSDGGRGSPWRRPCAEADAPGPDPGAGGIGRRRGQRAAGPTDGERPAVLRAELREPMFARCGVYRSGAAAGPGARARWHALRERARRPGRPGQGAPLQHRPGRRARARLPARLRRGDGHLGRGPHRESRARRPARTSPIATT